ncbi:aldehyde dehydrogenase family protein [Sphingomonas sp. HF-S3]|uniref:Aldehyde dehydrogenase family protein n=1 Tax=Sphingomonas rustica TaxID=3103142 RepID=A0ABV0B941_9SPHN
MRTLPVRNPRTGEQDYRIAPLDADAVASRAATLRAGQPRWAALDPSARGAALMALAEAIGRRREALLAALCADTGRRAISALEIDGVIGMLNRWARQAPETIGRHSPATRPSAMTGITLSTRLRPYPLVGIISPWNFPLTLAMIDAIPALAAGCAVLVKPSEVTPRFIAPMMDAIHDVPGLSDVLDVVEGDGATGAAIVSVVDMIAFTGSVATGRKVGEAAARAFIPASLELGGKDPMLVLDSADPDWAAQVALRASVVNTGQACQSIERVYVARSLYPQFLAALTAAAAATRLNADAIDRGEIGPFICAKQAAIVQRQIDQAVAAGARIMTGGAVETLGGGLYLRPTVLVDVTADMEVMREETFGPVIPVMAFDGIDDAVRLANSGKFGLSAAVLAGSAEEAEAVAARLDAGAVSINDGALTSMVWDAEKSSFGLSGLGPSRMGEAGLMRFFRKQALIRQTGGALPLAAYSEEALGQRP